MAEARQQQSAGASTGQSNQLQAQPSTGHSPQEIQRRGGGADGASTAAGSPAVALQYGPL